MTREHKIIGYRVAIVRPYGPDGEDLEVTPIGERYTDHVQAELAATRTRHALVIDLYLAGRSSADPPGPSRPHRWRMKCLSENDEPTFPTWSAAVVKMDGPHKHDNCQSEHHILTRDDAIRQLLLTTVSSPSPTEPPKALSRLTAGNRLPAHRRDRRSERMSSPRRPVTSPCFAPISTDSRRPEKGPERKEVSELPIPRGVLTERRSHREE